MVKNLRKKIIVVSSFAKDEKINFDTNIRTMSEGGPAFFIGKALKTLGAKYQLIRNKKTSRVRIKIAEREEEGKVVSLAPIVLPSHKTADIFLISTIGQEFKLRDIKMLSGLIALDCQGYIRKYKAKMQKMSIPKAIEDRISVLKATHSEISFLGEAFLQRQKKRILLITYGEKGFEIYAFGKRYFYASHRITLDDAVGAGDTLFAAFCFAYIGTRGIQKAALFARAHTEEFLKEKKKSVNRLKKNKRGPLRNGGNYKI